MSLKPLKKNGLQRSMTFCKSALLSGYNMSSSYIASCMEHSLHIACKHFVEGVAPTSPTAICKIKAALDNASLHGELDLDQLNGQLAALDFENIDGDDNDSDADIEFSPGNALGKALALVKQVSSNKCLIF